MERMEITNYIKVTPAQPKAQGPEAPRASRPARASEEGAPPPGQTAPAVPAQEVAAAVQELELRFDLKVEMATDEETGREVVRIFSKDGKRLLRQMPPEEVLQMADRARQGTLENLVHNRV